MGKYRKKHRKERRAYMKSYYEDHREERKASDRKYYESHRKERIAYSKNYRRTHRKEREKYARKNMRKLKKNPPYKKAGNYLREKLEELDKSQSWLALQLGVSREAVSEYLKGVYFPREERRRRLYKALEIKKSDLENLIEES